MIQRLKILSWRLQIISLTGGCRVGNRKTDHLRICAGELVESGDPGFDAYKLKTKSLPDVSLNEVDTTTTFLGKRLDFPLVIEAITGGTSEARKINKTLAAVAQEYGLGLGVGSQRPAIKDNKLAKTYQVRDVAEDILLIGNLGAVQLNYGFGLEECKAAVDMIDADALALHLNPLQEAAQPEGDTNFMGLAGKINKIASKLKTPVIAKEVGMGLDLESARKLKVSAYDVGGWGGTSWSLVESFRNKDFRRVGVTYSYTGTPTAECIRQLCRLDKPLIGSGGVRDGLDAVKAIALGADVVGVALPFLRCYYGGGEKAIRRYLDGLIREFKVGMFITGSKNLRQLGGRVY
ncbi:MAG: type 2 isopentenyl-diphosphate Delta-isomerase [Candidatus Altiarchaeota archaeon]|nr:type 2 isopentenyl-diphosphate Delta-isomerase [Candidatus Altiarchaeota archaeon]